MQNDNCNNHTQNKPTTKTQPRSEPQKNFHHTPTSTTQQNNIEVEKKHLNPQPNKPKNTTQHPNKQRNKPQKVAPQPPLTSTQTKKDTTQEKMMMQLNLQIISCNNRKQTRKPIQSSFVKSFNPRAPYNSKHERR